MKKIIKNGKIEGKIYIYIYVQKDFYIFIYRKDIDL